MTVAGVIRLVEKCVLTKSLKPLLPIKAAIITLIMITSPVAFVSIMMRTATGNIPPMKNGRR